MAPITPRGEKTREAILSAATAVVLESGAEDFSLREVARRAGLAPSALYNHFPNREALVQATAMRALGELRGFLGAAPEADSATERLRGLSRAYIAFAREKAAEYRLIFERLENPALSWEMYLVVADPFTLIVDGCLRGLQSGEFIDRAAVGPGGMAYGLWALCHGHASLTSRNLARIEGDLDALAFAAIDTTLAGFASDAPRGPQ